jgi:hypothetical protein
LKAGIFEVSGGRVSVQLDGGVTPRADAGLVLTRSILDGLATARSLSLRSFTTLDVVGSGSYTFSGQLLLGAGQVRGYGQGGAPVELRASSLVLEGGADAGAAAASDAGGLSLRAGLVRVGAGTLRIENFTGMEIIADQGVLLEGSGRLGAAGALTIQAPMLGAVGGVEAGLASSEALRVEAAGVGGQASVSSGFGASVALSGRSVVLTAPVELPGGSLFIHATGGGVEVGGVARLSGVSVALRDMKQFVDGGSLRVVSSGDVVLHGSALLDVSASSGGGNAGRLSISAPNGSVSFLGKVVGTAGSGGEGGSFSLDVRDALAGGLSRLGEALAEGGFVAKQEFRFRNGDVSVDGLLRAREFSLAADNGGISVTGRVDASGTTGGRISLMASGDVRLTASGVLDASAQRFDAAGKGGVIRGGDELGRDAAFGRGGTHGFIGG